MNKPTQTYYELDKALQAGESVRTLILHLPGDELSDSAFQRLSRLEQIEFHNREITNWPESLSTHPSLKKILFKNCRLNLQNWQLPAQLESLQFEGCSLTSTPILPPQLKKLEISGEEAGDKLNEFFQKLEQATELEQLSIRQIGLKKLPAPNGKKAQSIFKKLSKLKKLDLSRNRLKNVDELSASAFQQLNLSHNRLRHLPELHARSLIASNNKINSIDSNLLQASDLFELYLSQNQLEALPPLHLPQLSLLDLSHNPLQAWPPGLEHSRQLRLLRLNNTRLEKLPEPIPPLPALRSLELNNFRPAAGSAAWPRDLSPWSKLQTLRLRRSKLREIPPAFWQLQNLNACEGPPLLKRAARLLRAFHPYTSEEERRWLPQIWEMLQSKDYKKTALPRKLLLRLLSAKHPALRQLAEAQLPIEQPSPEKIPETREVHACLIGRSAIPLQMLEKLFARHHIRLLTQKEEADFFILCSRARPAEIELPENAKLFAEKPFISYLYQKAPITDEQEQKIAAMLQSGDADMIRAGLKLLLLYGPSRRLNPILEKLKRQKDAAWKSLLQAIFQALLLISLCLSASSAAAQTPWYEPADSFHRKRFWITAGSGTAIYSGLSVGLWKIWYAQYELTPFHTFNDWPEWQQVDKAGHLFSAYNAARWSYHGARWTGMDEKKAARTAAGIGIGILSTIEIMDGFSAKWGFSWGDMSANIAGSSLFFFQQLAWHEQRILVKVSSSHPPYSDALVHASNSSATSSPAQRAAALYGRAPFERFLKDYNAQVNWLSVNLSSMLGPSRPDWLPPWLNLAIGYGAENMYGGFDNSWQEGDNLFELSPEEYPRYRQYFLSFDIDLSRLPVEDKPLLRGLCQILNFIKIPSPTLEVNGLGKVKFYPIYW